MTICHQPFSHKDLKPLLDIYLLLSLSTHCLLLNNMYLVLSTSYLALSVLPRTKKLSSDKALSFLPYHLKKTKLFSNSSSTQLHVDWCPWASQASSFFLLSQQPIRFLFWISLWPSCLLVVRLPVFFLSAHAASRRLFLYMTTFPKQLACKLFL